MINNWSNIFFRFFLMEVIFVCHSCNKQITGEVMKCYNCESVSYCSIKCMCHDRIFMVLKACEYFVCVHRQLYGNNESEIIIS